MSLSRLLRTFVSHLLPVLVWSALVAVLLLTPVGEVSRLPAPIGWLFGLSGFWMDIAGHLVVFAILGILVARSMRAFGVARVTIAAVALSTVYGAFLELGQIPVPGRTFQGLDLVSNGVGAAVGAWLNSLATPSLYSPRSRNASWRRHNPPP